MPGVQNIVTFVSHLFFDLFLAGEGEIRTKSFKISIAETDVDDFTEVVRAQRWRLEVGRASVHQLHATSRAMTIPVKS
jgi:hypothetical protein